MISDFIALNCIYMLKSVTMPKPRRTTSIVLSAVLLDHMIGNALTWSCNGMKNLIAVVLAILWTSP